MSSTGSIKREEREDLKNRFGTKRKKGSMCEGPVRDVTRDKSRFLFQNHAVYVWFLRNVTRELLLVRVYSYLALS